MTRTSILHGSARLAVLITALAGGTAAWAQDANWTVAGEAGVVSDYRYRGLSLSGTEPALQAGLTVEHASGFYADGYVSSIEEYGVGADGDGAKSEFTLTSGWAGMWSGLEVDAAVSYVAYPDGSGVNYVEFPVEIARTVGNARLSVGIAYAPAQDALGDEDNGYAWVGVDYGRANWPFELTARVGREDGAYAPGGKTDWTVGAEVPVGAVSLGLAWTDSDVDDGAVVASVFARF